MTPPWGPAAAGAPPRQSPPPAPASPDGFPAHTVTLPVAAAPVILARRTAQMTFATFGLAPSASLLDAARLVTTELVADAVCHATASGHLDLTVALSDNQLAVACHDEDPALPPWPPAVRYGTARTGLTVLAELVAGHGGRLDMQPDHAAPGRTIRVFLPRTP